ncbi:hypothetical protein B0H16DRAFT_1560386 [Mycena metata]|uniref:Zn(2)-C6 fungal-type domain-containing protein n=1 Tax=Mycena metata TaxID=1033252 RepID=A0AAD7IIV7_9AGAR|nr:hypothetical protein B0H16DRAFT_1560386 [Mycena metata]
MLCRACAGPLRPVFGPVGQWTRSKNSCAQPAGRQVGCFWRALQKEYKYNRSNPQALSSSSIQRGPRACTNCRRRKIKCDGARPICSQCRLRPPRSKELCQYPHIEGQDPMDLPAQLLETISALRSRIGELEYLATPDPTRVYLSSPYSGDRQGVSTPDNFSDYGGTSGRSSPVDIREPPAHVVADLVNTFLNRFASSGYFFLSPTQFQASALLPLPFGHHGRPSPVLLSAVYLWGSLLSPVTLNEPYTPGAFLPYVLKNLYPALADMAGNSQLLLETIQAELLVSLYYLHSASPIQGRYHAAAAASIAVGAGLQDSLLRPGQRRGLYPPFVLATTVHDMEEHVRIDAFRAVVIVNNYWVATEGSPSALCGEPSLTDDDSHGTTPTVFLAKASVLLGRVISFSTHVLDTSDPTTLPSLDSALHTLHAALPPLPGAQTHFISGLQAVVLTHALVDFALVRLHTPYMSNSDSARAKCLTAAARIVAGVAAISILDGASNTDPMFGPIYAGVASVYMHEIAALAHQLGAGRGRGSRVQTEVRELETRLGSLMGAMASLAAYSPLFERCFVDMRAAYAAMSSSR